MERPKGSKALLCIMLLTLAQLLTPGLAQAAPPPTASNATAGTTQLLPATVPYTAEQIRCFTMAAANSEAANTYYEVSALLGMVSVYGNDTKMLADLTAVPGASDLMELSVSTVNADYQKWVTDTMEGCGMLELRDGSGADLTPDQVVAWLNSLSTTGLLAGMGFNMTAPLGTNDEELASTDFSAALTAAGMPAAVRRRLLFWKSLAAMASGATLGFGSTMMAHMAGNAAQAMVVSAFVLASAPASITGFGGMLAYAAVSRLVKSKVDTAATVVVDKLTDDPKVKDQFNRAMAFGSSVATAGIDHGIASKGVSLKVLRLAVKSELKSKQAELIAQGREALTQYAWAQANTHMPGVTELLSDLSAKVGAIQRLSATAADVSRANWKTVAADVVSKAVEEAGLNPADLLTDALAATFEPTPGVEPTEGAGELTDGTTDLEIPANVAGGTAIDSAEGSDTWDILNDPSVAQADEVTTSDGGENDSAGGDITTSTSNDTSDDNQEDGPTSTPDDSNGSGDDSGDVDTSPSTPDDNGSGDDSGDVDSSPTTPDDNGSSDDSGDVDTSPTTPDDNGSSDDSGDVDTSPSTPEDNGSSDDSGDVDTSPSTPEDNGSSDDSGDVDTSPSTPDDSSNTDDASSTPDYFG